MMNVLILQSGDFKYSRERGPKRLPRLRTLIIQMNTFLLEHFHI